MLDQTKCPFSASFKIETTEASHNNGAFEFLPSKVSRDISCAKKYKKKSYYSKYESSGKRMASLKMIRVLHVFCLMSRTLVDITIGL